MVSCFDLKSNQWRYYVCNDDIPHMAAIRRDLQRTGARWSIRFFLFSSACLSRSEWAILNIEKGLSTDNQHTDNRPSNDNQQTDNSQVTTMEESENYINR